MTFKEIDLLYDLECNVPIFCRDGSKIRWAHKSLQDYFLACYISNSSSKETMISNLYEKKIENLLNVVDFLYELEPILFREKILLPFIQSFIYYCDNTYLSYPQKLSIEIKKRQAFCFLTPFFIYTKKGDSRSDISSNEYPEGFNRKLSIHSYRKGMIFLEVYGETFENLLSRMLYSKKIEIYSIADGFDEIAFSNIWTEWKEKQITYLTDEKSHVFNKAANFAKVTSTLLRIDSLIRDHGNTVDDFYLDYEKCKILVNDIKSSFVVNRDEDIF